MEKGLWMEGLRDLRPEKKPRASPCGDFMLSLIHFVNTEFQAACQRQTLQMVLNPYSYPGRQATSLGPFYSKEN